MVTDASLKILQDPSQNERETPQERQGKRREKTRESECVREQEGEQEKQRECVGLHIITTHVRVHRRHFATEGTVITYCATGTLFLMKCQNR